MPQDPTSNQQSEQLPTYNAYSIDGDVTGPLVYANYGIPADYDELERHGISVKGAIVITRYGGSWRGIKPKVAAEHGAIGCLIYSDPHDDGYSEGSVFPEGAYRPQEGVQRGSVADMPLYPGDPLTPGIGATADAKRLPSKMLPRSPRFPCCPFLMAMRNLCLPPWVDPLHQRRGADRLPITYRLGAGPARVHLKVDVELGYQADLRRDRENSGLDRARRMDHSWQSSRCLGERSRRSDLRAGGRARGSARFRRIGQGGAGSPSARLFTARGTAKSRVCSVPRSGPKHTRTS